jgi:DNA replication initiation complex subunit (GINS family)
MEEQFYNNLNETLRQLLEQKGKIDKKMIEPTDDAEEKLCTSLSVHLSSALKSLAKVRTIQKKYNEEM